MAKSPPPIVTHVIELLAPMGPVAARFMFGGWGLSLEGRTFALVADDQLYLKVDDHNRSSFTDLGLTPFAPFPDQPDKTMGYYPPPADALEDADSLLPWARDAYAAALRVPVKAKRRK